MIPAIGKMQMFSQVTKTYVICKYAIRWEIIGDLESFDHFRGFLLEGDLDFRSAFFSSHKELTASSSKSIFDTIPIR
jgi:hypothetical protein